MLGGWRRLYELELVLPWLRLYGRSSWFLGNVHFPSFSCWSFEIGLIFTRGLVREGLESGGLTSEELDEMITGLGPSLQPVVGSSWIHYCAGMIAVALGVNARFPAGGSPVVDSPFSTASTWLVRILVDFLEGVLKDSVHLSCLRRQLMVGDR